MIEILLFVKDFELASKISECCVDHNRNIDFSDEHSDPADFPESVKLAIVDFDEQVFSSVGLVSGLKQRNLKLIGIMHKISNKNQKKLRSSGCDIILTKSSIVKNLPNLFSEFFD
tara:strand:+ start:28 stop:372 length:345 start_codon:yes stop_codon:yes gene_type:complete